MCGGFLSVGVVFNVFVNECDRDVDKVFTRCLPGHT